MVLVDLYHSWRMKCGRVVHQTIRIASCAGLVLLYVKLRAWLAGDHLVRIYRKVR